MTRVRRRVGRWTNPRNVSTMNNAALLEAGAALKNVAFGEGAYAKNGPRTSVPRIFASCRQQERRD